MSERYQKIHDQASFEHDINNPKHRYSDGTPVNFVEQPILIDRWFGLIEKSETYANASPTVGKLCHALEKAYLDQEKLLLEIADLREEIKMLRKALGRD